MLIMIAIIACFTVFAILAQWAISRPAPKPGIGDCLRHSANARDAQSAETKRRVAEVMEQNK